MPPEITSRMSQDKGAADEGNDTARRAVFAKPAKVTLVKPQQAQDGDSVTQDDNESADMMTRPKVGRGPSRVIYDSTQDTSELYGIAEEYTRPGQHDEDGHYADLEQGKVWDSRFTLLLVTLLIAVNFALVTLLHNSHKDTPARVETGENANLVVTHKPAPVAVLQKEPNPPVHAPAIVAVPAPATVPAPTPIQATAAQQRSLLNLPGASPAAGRPAANPQQLLSIINKE